VNKKISLPINQWKEDDRPREKMLSKGRESLSDAELVAILIGSGNRQESAVDLSKRILASVNNNLNELATLSISDLMKFKGVGEAKAISIITAITLGRRTQLENAMSKPIIKSSKSVFNIMQPIIGNLDHEEFWVIFLNNANKIIHKRQISKGGITSTIVDSRIVFKKALEISAVAVILCHNHPSGKKTPSVEDENLTKKLYKAGKTLDIQVLDHLIIVQNDYFSFADSKMMG